MEQIQKIKSLQRNRKNSIWFATNFFINYAVTIACLDEALKCVPRHYHQELFRGHVIRSVSCLETFFRDLIIFILDSDPTTLKLVLKDIKQKHTLAEVQQILQEGISTSEIAVHNLNLQNIQGIQKVFSLFFPDNDYLGFLNKYRPSIIFSLHEKPSFYGDVKEFIYLTGNWQEQFKTLFDLRHEFTHDANCQTELTLEEIQRTQWLLFKVTQFTTFYVAEKIDRCMLPVTKEDQETPYFFTPESVWKNSFQIASEDSIHSIYLKNRPSIPYEVNPQ